MSQHTVTTEKLQICPPAHKFTTQQRHITKYWPHVHCKYSSWSWSRVRSNVPPNTLYVISGTSFYRSNNPTNSVKALKEEATYLNSNKPQPDKLARHMYNVQLLQYSCRTITLMDIRQHWCVLSPAHHMLATAELHASAQNWRQANALTADHFSCSNLQNI